MTNLLNIVEVAKMCSKVYLAAMIDGEGSVVFQQKKQNRFIAIYSSENQIIQNCIDCLNTLNISYYVVKTKKQCTHGEFLQLTISNQANLMKLHRCISMLLCERKKALFNDLIGSYKYRKHLLS